MSTTNIASPATSSRAQNLNWLTFHLTKARFRSHQGESLLYLASILAYTVCAGLALTVAGGTYMFYNRWQTPTGIAAQLLKADASFQIMLKPYFLLAILACALIIPSLSSLATKAAVLGARGREKRLASLRLLGVSSAEVTKMTLLDTLVATVDSAGSYYFTGTDFFLVGYAAGKSFSPGSNPPGEPTGTAHLAPGSCLSYFYRRFYCQPGDLGVIKNQDDSDSLGHYPGSYFGVQFTRPLPVATKCPLAGKNPDSRDGTGVSADSG